MNRRSEEEKSLSEFNIHEYILPRRNTFEVRSDMGNSYHFVISAINTISNIYEKPVNNDSYWCIQITSNFYKKELKYKNKELAFTVLQYILNILNK